MTERITSPEQLNRRMKINHVGVWILLAVLTVALITGLILLASRDIVIRESHLCYVTGTSGPSMDMLYELFMAETGNREDMTREKITETYGEALSPYSQIAYFLVRNMEETEIAEGMTVRADGSEGRVVSIPREMTDYEQILQAGVSEEEIRKAGLMPGIPYHLIVAFFPCGETGPDLTPGFCSAEVILNVLNPVSVIL